MASSPPPPPPPPPPSYDDSNDSNENFGARLPSFNLGEIRRVKIRVDALETDMDFLTGSLKFPGGKIKELELEVVDIRSEVQPEVDKALREWIASSQFPILIANTVVAVLKSRRTTLAKTLAKPAIQVTVGVITTFIATLLILYFTAQHGVVK